MKYWVKYVLAVIIIFLVCLFIKFVPFWVTAILITFCIGSHLFYRYLMCKDVLK